jgi:hypothetical protein
LVFSVDGKDQGVDGRLYHVFESHPIGQMIVDGGLKQRWPDPEANISSTFGARMVSAIEYPERFHGATPQEELDPSQSSPDFGSLTRAGHLPENGYAD